MQIEIHKEVAHLLNKQNQLPDKQDILQSLLMKESGILISNPPVMSHVTNILKPSAFNAVAWIFTTRTSYTKFCYKGFCYQGK